MRTGLGNRSRTGSTPCERSQLADGATNNGQYRCVCATRWFHLLSRRKLYREAVTPMKIQHTREVDVPDGDRCVSYDGQPSPRCSMLRETSSVVGPHDGLGSGGTMYFQHCALFDWGLTLKVRYGVLKCPPCMMHGVTGSKHSIKKEGSES